MKTTKKLNTEEFIKRSILVHGDKYDYSKSFYKNDSTKIEIICKKHGSFWQSPGAHVRQKNGCESCSYEERAFQKRRFAIKDKDDFESKLKELNIYENFDFSNSIFEYFGKKMKVVCKKHGEFYQTPLSFILKKYPCKKCFDDSLKSNTEEFINKSLKVHGNLFDYSKSIYKGAFDNVEIICKKHGSFWQRPANHLSGWGCRTCLESTGEKEIKRILEEKNIIYETQKTFNDLISIKTNKNLYFDVYIPTSTLVIEYDGRQHFESIEFFGGDEYLNNLKFNDNLKNEYCKNKNIKLIRISYKDNISKKNGRGLK